MAKKTYEEIEKKYSDLLEEYVDWIVDRIHCWTDNYPDGAFRDYKIIVSDEELKKVPQYDISCIIDALIEIDEAQENYEKFIEIDKKIDDNEEITTEEKSFWDEYEGFRNNRYTDFYCCRYDSPFEKFREVLFNDNEGLQNAYYPYICEKPYTITREKTEEELEADAEEYRKRYK